MQLLYVRSDEAVSLATSKFLGLKVYDHPMELVTRDVIDSLGNHAPVTIVPLNPHVYCSALRVPEVAGLLKRSHVTMDGIGIQLVSRLLRQPLQHRFTGSDLMESLLVQLARRGRSVFLLGGQDGVTRECASIVMRRFPGLRIAGMLEPPFVPHAAELPEDEIVETVNRSGADALFVAFGAPKQETFLHRNRERLTVPLAMTVGASFDFIAHRKRRAPVWMRRRGVEWVFRILQEPFRLGPRYAFGIPRFLWYTLVKGRSL